MRLESRKSRTATSAAAVHISWAAPFNGGSPILGYIVERKSSPAALWTSLTVAADSYTSTTYVDTFQLVARPNAAKLGSQAQLLLEEPLSRSSLPGLLTRPGSCL